MYLRWRVNLDTCAGGDTKFIQRAVPGGESPFSEWRTARVAPYWDIELAHQVEFVGLDGFYAEFEGARDLFDGLAFSQHFENLALAFGERAEMGLAGGSVALHAEIIDQAGEQAWAQVTAAARDFADGGDELLGRAVLEDIAAGPDVEALGQIVLVVIHGEIDHLGIGAFLANLTGRLEATHTGHTDIHQDNVGPHLLRHRDGIQRVAGFSDDFHIGFGGQQGPDTVPEKCMIVG